MVSSKNAANFLTAMILVSSTSCAVIGVSAEPVVAAILHPQEHKIPWGDVTGQNPDPYFPFNLGFDGILGFSFNFIVPAPPDTDSHGHSYLHSQLETVTIFPTFRNAPGTSGRQTLIAVLYGNPAIYVDGLASGSPGNFQLSQIFNAPTTLTIRGDLRLRNISGEEINPDVVIVDSLTAVANGTHHYVPTPALLPGLIGMGIAALRKRSQEDNGAEV